LRAVVFCFERDLWAKKYMIATAIRTGIEGARVAVVAIHAAAGVGVGGAAGVFVGIEYPVIVVIGVLAVGDAVAIGVAAAGIGVVPTAGVFVLVVDAVIVVIRVLVVGDAVLRASIGYH
jgi:hypothetical protein